MSKFDAESYRRYRPTYPAPLFERLPSLLERAGFAAPFEVADIGCGTGHSALSLLLAGVPARVTGVDPDPSMLEQARVLPGLESAPARFVEGTGEETGLASGAFDAAIVGSAFHWMDAARARDELARILRPGGIAMVFEYQFPKLPGLPALNEWIRREFNLRWKAPGQVPRGDFARVTGVLREPPFCLEGKAPFERVPMRPGVTAHELFGLILSQSRVLHFEAALPPAGRGEFRRGLLDHLLREMGEGRHEADFSLTAASFRLG